MAIDYLRRQRKDKKQVRPTESVSDISPYSLVEQDEEKKALYKVIQGLNKDYAEVLVLTAEGLTPDEISKTTKKKKKAVYDLLYRARKKLKEVITEAKDED